MERVRPYRRTICWFSCGAASAVATKIILKEQRKGVEIIYCDTGSEHEDNERFLEDCSKWFKQPIIRLKNPEYEDTWDVWEKRKYLSGIHGAPCTTELKMQPRLEYQRPDDIHVFGYTYDIRDAARAVRLRKTFFELTIETPLITNRINKEGCLALVEEAQIKLPVLYEQGYVNNNCIPCVKSESPAYWALVRKTYPDQYKRMSILDRKYGNGLIFYKGKRIHLDELPDNIPRRKPTVPTCDFMCGSLSIKNEVDEV